MNTKIYCDFETCFTSGRSAALLTWAGPISDFMWDQNCLFYESLNFKSISIFQARFPLHVAALKHISRGYQKTLEFTSLAVMYQFLLEKSIIFDLKVYFTGIFIKSGMNFFLKFWDRNYLFFRYLGSILIFKNHGGQKHTL